MAMNPDDLLLFLPFNEPAGSQYFYDWSPNALSVTSRTGDTSYQYYDNLPATTAAQSKFYATSYRNRASNGSTSPRTYLSINDVLPLLEGLASFTIEFWYWRDTSGAGQEVLVAINNKTDGGNTYVLTVSNIFGDATFATTGYPSALPTGGWRHFAAVRAPSEIRLYDHGSLFLTVPASANSVSTTDAFYLFAEADGGSQPGDMAEDVFDGYMQDFIISRGERYTGNSFTPPGAFLKTLSGTVMGDDGQPKPGIEVVAIPRCQSKRSYSGVTDANGDFAIQVPDIECSVVALDDGSGAIYNDLVAGRVVPA